METEEAISQTAALAQKLLWTSDGRPRGFEEYIHVFFFQTIFRPVNKDEIDRFPPGMTWIATNKGQLYQFDDGLAGLLILDAREGCYFSHRLVMMAAGMILGHTKSITDPALHKYVCDSL